MPSEYFGSILEQRLSRRSFVVGTSLATAFTTLPTLSLAAQPATPVQKAVTTAIEPTRADTLTLAAGLRSDLLIRAGDALFKNMALALGFMTLLLPRAERCDETPNTVDNPSPGHVLTSDCCTALLSAFKKSSYSPLASKFRVAVPMASNLGSNVATVSWSCFSSCTLSR